MERAIVSVWLEVLPVEQISVHDNFFDLGGTSQLMIDAHYKLCKLLERDDVTILDMFFLYPTIATLAEFLSGKNQENTSLLQKVSYLERKLSLHDNVRQAQQKQRLSRLAHRTGNKTV